MCIDVTVQLELTPGVFSLVSLSKKEKNPSFTFRFGKEDICVQQNWSKWALSTCLNASLNWELNF